MPKSGRFSFITRSNLYFVPGMYREYVSGSMHPDPEPKKVEEEMRGEENLEDVLADVVPGSAS